MTIGETINANAGASDVFLNSFTTADSISIGGDAADQLDLSEAELDLITAATLHIGGTHGGDIFITTERVEDRARISIKDSGEGMSDDIREHIFEPFFTTREVGQGTGLGLSITFSIIEEHHGTIEVESAPGKGSEFIITLPLQRDE